MYGALRPALRARRPPARFIHRRRHPSARRHFHSTPSRADDPNTPAGADGRPIDTGKNGAADKKKGETAAAAATEIPDGGIATEDAELLAQKLQRAREMTRRYSSALRRTQRRDRAKDLPPVVIPAEFLKKRVFLRDDPRLQPLNNPEFTLSLRRRHADDAAQCSIPITDPSIGVKLLTQWILTAWDGGVSRSQNRHVARKLAAAWGLGQDEELLDALMRGDDLGASAKALRGRIRVSLVAVKEALAETYRLIHFSGNERLIAMKQQWEAHDSALAASIRTYERLVGSHDRNKDRALVSPFVLAEIRATMAASLSVLQPGSDTYPSARTNLTLHSPFSHLDSTINHTVKALASELGADVVELSAQDLAEIGGDYLGDGPEPSSHSIRSLGYETYKMSSDLSGIVDEFGDDAAEEGDITPRPMVFPLSSVFKDLTQHLKAFTTSTAEPEPPSNEGQGRVQSQVELQLEDLKIANLLEHIIGSVETKLSSSHDTVDTKARPSFSNVTTPESSSPRFFDLSLAPTTDMINLDTALPYRVVSKIDFSLNISPPRKRATTPSRSKVILIRDIKELSATHYGSRIVQKLEEIIRKRRNTGESIMIVGTTCSRDLVPELSVDGVQGLQADGESAFFRNIVVPAEKIEASRCSPIYPTELVSGEARSSAGLAEKAKFRAINLRHIQTMLHSLDPVASLAISDRLDERNLEDLHVSIPLFPKIFSTKVLTHDEVHRIALTALGLRFVNPSTQSLAWTHVALAMALLRASDQVKFEYIKRKPEILKSFRGENGSAARLKKISSRTKTRIGGVTRDDRERQLKVIGLDADRYEKRLMTGIVNPDQIKTGFDQVHVPAETIEAIRTLTSLSFLRPDAFNYGVLATEKISGALLYGPPGTGKTLLAKAVAKESGCAVLEISGSQIHDKYVGEGEKNVTAIFSLARKLSPCVVFLDEADAVLSSRDTGRERASARDILNQFLKEWDGLSNHSVFVMVATNRPFDLDDAVIRRLPRRLLIDLPTENDRKEILKIHLRGEQLDDSVNVEALAKQTPFYSGSDLKNVAVAAALACVKEENVAAIAARTASRSTESPDFSNLVPPVPSSQTTSLHLLQGTDYKFPDKRTLHARHFDMALQEISASISEDMSSLNAIKKFDEKYGDKKGKKKKTVFGIGLGTEVSENVARVCVVLQGVRAGGQTPNGPTGGPMSVLIIDISSTVLGYGHYQHQLTTPPPNNPLDTNRKMSGLARLAFHRTLSSASVDSIMPPSTEPPIASKFVTKPLQNQRLPRSSRTDPLHRTHGTKPADKNSNDADADATGEEDAKEIITPLTKSEKIDIIKEEMRKLDERYEQTIVAKEEELKRDIGARMRELRALRKEKKRDMEELMGRLAAELRL
ncbi:AAA-domain-containing protein [Byssothecium circinans]|uniref:AAA-domain-containing protein n=1 Tax=Byssothecium circinans TaxID=147558 RepID=A0A6A5UG53_9PLEO|nr:AAA-domain-containing protein [Byssothecium circinans]